MAKKQNPVLVEAAHRGDYAYFAYQLRYGKNPRSYKKKDIKKALPIIDRWAYEAAEEIHG